tara:strand:- start:52087 stop:52602 length:516 start_codon:yes stop_codon:yes gene_type:complete
MKIIFRRRFEAAHRFYEKANRSSKCAQPHGHSWFVEACISKEKPELHSATNMLKSFEELKTKWHAWIDQHVDHAFFVNSKDPLLNFLREDNPEGRLLVTPGDPTTEILAVLFKAKLAAFLDELKEDYYVTSMKIEETPTNAVVFDGNPQNYIDENKIDTEKWWLKADMSTY